MKKLISLILALILVLSLIPLATMAATKTETVHVRDDNTGKWYQYDTTTNSPGAEVTDSDLLAKLNKSYADYLASLKEVVVPVHEPNKHEFSGYGCDTKYHWLECACGCRISVEPHVDPLETENDYCVCGYHFSDNAQLVTLWLQDCEGLKFRKDVYEYETDAFTYKDVKEIKRIAVRTHDSEATVELPEDLTLKEGENKFEIKVTAENKKVTQTYTVIVNKEAKK